MLQYYQLSVLCVVLLWIPGSVNGAAVTTKKPEEAKQCSADIYCPGENFKARNILGDHFIQCDAAPQPRDQCCLPEEKHLVCYNIMVDGHFLNFDDASPAKATDFNALCNAIVQSLGKEPGNYAKVTLDDSAGGYIRYNYGEFKELKYASKQHIKDLACGLAGDWPGKPKTLPTTTSTTTTTRRASTTTKKN